MATSSYKPVTHIIFDLDGTLLDTEPLYKDLYSTAMTNLGAPPLTWELKAKMLGLTETDAVKYIIQEMNMKCTVDEFKVALHEKEHEVLVNAQLLPGAERLICHFAKNKIPMAIATSSTQSSVSAKLKNHEKLFKNINHLVAGNDDPEVAKGKPAPDIFLVCGKRFPDNPSPKSCLVFEDAPNGVKGSLSACMQVVMIPDPKLDKELTKCATLTIASLNDFKPELFSLPPFPSTCN